MKISTVALNTLRTRPASHTLVHAHALLALHTLEAIQKSSVRREDTEHRSKCHIVILTSVRRLTEYRNLECVSGNRRTG